jgi:hypothetical protein
MGSGNSGSHVQEVQETKADSSGVTSGSIDDSDEEESSDKFVEGDDGGVFHPLHAPGWLLAFHSVFVCLFDYKI